MWYGTNTTWRYNFPVLPNYPVLILCILQILPQFQCAEEKNRLLRAVAGAGLDSLSSLRAKWDKLELVMESHQLMIKEQVTYTVFFLLQIFLKPFFAFFISPSFAISSISCRFLFFPLMSLSHSCSALLPQVEVMRSNAAGRVDAYRMDLERFKARWDQLKPKDEMLETGDHAALLACLQTIRDKQQEFQELELVRNKLL